MTYTFRPATRSEAKPLIGLYSESGAGKTYSALLLARGFVGPEGRIGMIETESGRGEAYADPAEYPEIGGYEVLPLRDDFSPSAYGQSITAAEQANLDALIIDSASHEWEGVGGVLAMAAANQEAGRKGPIVWQKPKLAHQREFMLRFMQTSVPLVILCMRARYPMREVPKPGGGKEWRRADVLDPKQADDILFECFVHGWIGREDHAFNLTKCTAKALESVFARQPITLETGQALAEWARGGRPGQAIQGERSSEESAPPGPTLEMAQAWLGKMQERFTKIDTPGALESFMAKQQHHIGRMRDAFPDYAASCVDAYDNRLRDLSPGDGPAGLE